MACVLTDLCETRIGSVVERACGVGVGRGRRCRRGGDGQRQEGAIARLEGRYPLLGTIMGSIGMAVAFLMERKGGEVLRIVEEVLWRESLALLVVDQAQASA